MSYQCPVGSLGSQSILLLELKLQLLRTIFLPSLYTCVHDQDRCGRLGQKAYRSNSFILVICQIDQIWGLYISSALPITKSVFGIIYLSEYRTSGNVMGNRRTILTPVSTLIGYCFNSSNERRVVVDCHKYPISRMIVQFRGISHSTATAYDD